MQKRTQIVVISEILGHLHFSIRHQHMKYTDQNLGNLAPPHLIECFSCLLLGCAVNWYFVESPSLQSPFLYDFNSPARVSHFYSKWLYASAQPISKKQCHTSLSFLLYPMSFLIPFLPVQTQLGSCQDKNHPLASVPGPGDSWKVPDSGQPEVGCLCFILQD